MDDRPIMTTSRICPFRMNRIASRSWPAISPPAMDAIVRTSPLSISRALNDSPQRRGGAEEKRAAEGKHRWPSERGRRVTHKRGVGKPKRLSHFGDLAPNGRDRPGGLSYTGTVERLRLSKLRSMAKDQRAEEHTSE